MRQHLEIILETERYAFQAHTRDATASELPDSME